MSALFQSVAYILATIPGLATLRTGILAPPGYGVIFGGLNTSLGVLTILIIKMYADHIKCMQKEKLRNSAIALVLVALISLSLYLWLYHTCVIVNERGTFYMPIFLDGKLADMVSMAHGRHAATRQFGKAAINEALGQISGNSLALTTIISLILYEAIYIPIVSAFALLGIRLRSAEHL